MKPSFSKTFLNETLESFHLIDTNDPYQVYALFYLIDCTCSICGDKIDFPELAGDPPSGEWAKKTAAFIKQSGWYVPPVLNEIYSLEAVCPRCLAQSKG